MILRPEKTQLKLSLDKNKWVAFRVICVASGVTPSQLFERLVDRVIAEFHEPDCLIDPVKAKEKILSFL